MRISDKAIQDFQHIYKREFGEQLSAGDAQEIAERLLQLFLLIYKPLPSDHCCSSCASDGLKVDTSK